MAIKKHTNKLFFDKGAIPTTTPVGNRVNFTTTPGGNRASTLNHYIFVNFSCMPNFSLIGYVEVGFYYFPGRWLRSLCVGRWLRSLCVTGCGAYVSVLSRFKASTVQLNLPTGTELGNKDAVMAFYFNKQIRNVRNSKVQITFSKNWKIQSHFLLITRL